MLAKIAFENDLIELEKFHKLFDENQAKPKEQQLSPIEILEHLFFQREKILTSLPDIFRLPDVEDFDPVWLPFKRIWAITNKVITTNYDLALDENKPPSIDKVVYHNNYQLKYLLESDKFLFKLHGCIQADPGKCVLFKEQYQVIYDAISSKTTIDLTTEHEAKFLLKNLITNYTILFIGYGIAGDVDIDYTFKYIDEILSRVTEKRHFRISSAGDVIERSYLTNLIDGYENLQDNLSTLAAYRPSARPRSDAFDPYHHEYVGRSVAITTLNEFLKNENERFLFIHGRGGIGKSHFLKKVINESKTEFVYIKLISSYDIYSLADRLGLGYIYPEKDKNVPNQDFLTKIEERKELIILDDFYEIDYDNQLRITLLELVNSRKGKFIIVSRTLDAYFLASGRSTNELRFDLLPEKDHRGFLESYCNNRHGKLLEEEILHQIWRISQGYPLISTLLLDNKMYYDDFELSHIDKWDFEADKDGKNTVGKILDVIVRKGSEEQREFIYDLSQAQEALPYDIVRELPNCSGRDTFKALAYRKHIIEKNDAGQYTLHALVRELLRKRASDRYSANEVLADYYYKLFVSSNTNDTRSFRLCQYHIRLASEEAGEKFDRLFNDQLISPRVKQLQTSDSENYIEKLSYRIKHKNADAADLNELAREYLKQKKFKEAENIVNQGLSSFATNEHLLFTKAHLLSKTGRENDAVDILENLGAAGNTHALFQLAKLSYQKNQLKECFNLLESIELLEQNNAQALQYKGMAYYQLKQWDEAMRCFDRILSQKGEENNSQALQYKGMVHFQLKQWDEAMNCFEKKLAQKDETGSAQALLYKGMVHFQLKEWFESMSCFERILAQKGKESDVQALQYKGMVHFQLKHWNEAKSSFESILASKDEEINVQALQYKGMVHFQLRQWGEAMRCFEKILVQSSEESNVQALQYKGMLHFQIKQWSEAMSCFERILTLRGEENNVQALQYKGMVHFQLKQWSEAMRCFERILALKGEENNVQARQYKGMVHFQLRQWVDAIRCFERITVLKGEENNVQALQYKGMVHFQFKQWDEAIGCFEKILAQDGVEKNAQALLYKGKSLIAKELYYDAIQCLSSAEINNCRNVEIINELGNAYRRNGEYEKAIRKYEQAIVLRSRNIQSFNGIYQTLMIQRKFSDALNIVDRIISEKIYDIQLIRDGIYLCIDGRYKIFNFDKARQLLDSLAAMNIENRNVVIDELRSRIDSFEENTKRRNS